MKYELESGEVVTVLRHASKDIAAIQFQRPKPYVLPVLTKLLLNGKLENPKVPSIYGVGFLGVGEHSSTHPAFNHWLFLLDRCYSNKSSAYKGVSVHVPWHNFQEYAEWYSETHIEGFHLDKDIKVEGNKVYCPNRCLWVPPEINRIFCRSGRSTKGYEKHKACYRTSIQVDNSVRRKSFKTAHEARGQYFIWRSRAMWRQIKTFDLDETLLGHCRKRCEVLLMYGAGLQAGKIPM